MNLDFRHTIEYFLHDDTAIPPNNKHGTDAGWDLYIPGRHLKDSLVIKPHDFMIIDTKVSIYLPDGVFGFITEKSRGFHKIIGGVVDPRYDGTIRVKMINPYGTSMKFSGGDSIAQIIFLPFVMARMYELESPKKMDSRINGGIVNQESR